MAAAATGIWNHLSTAGLPGATAMDSSASGTDGSSSTDSATISANDFLTLLVTEMQNQDPTADTDPNEYINQLVNVNSLEQLININQTLSSAAGSTTPTGGVTGTGSPSADHGAKRIGAVSQAPVSTPAISPGASIAHRAGLRQAPGNLSIPEPSAAAGQVAQALSGRHIAP